MNILITSIGKRVQLIKYLGKKLKIIGVDCSDLIPSKNFVHKFYKVPKNDNDNYVDKLLDICKVENINMIIPLHEKEFIKLDKNRIKFKELGIELLLSSNRIIEICNDKIKTNEFFYLNNILSPRTYLKSNIESKILNNENINFPLIIKPIDGMGSINVFKINNDDELKFFINYVPNSIIQEFISGEEYTIDVLLDLKGKIISIVPRLRIEVIGGEVSKSKVENIPELIGKTELLINCLNKYGLVKGPLTIQCISNPQGIYFLEINCRFGGGVPLSFESGIDYADVFEDMYKGKHVDRILHFKELTMLRYNEGVFIGDSK